MFWSLFSCYLYIYLQYNTGHSLNVSKDNPQILGTPRRGGSCKTVALYHGLFLIWTKSWKSLGNGTHIVFWGRELTRISSAKVWRLLRMKSGRVSFTFQADFFQFCFISLLDLWISSTFSSVRSASSDCKVLARISWKLLEELEACVSRRGSLWEGRKIMMVVIDYERIYRIL
jgi:hypothetical protein